MSTFSTPSAASPAQPARRSLLKRLSGVVAGSFLAAPLQALLGRTTPAAAGTLTGGQDGYIGEIIMVPFDYAPRNYATCDGQLLSISQYTALYALIGTTYGGDGRTTFALPNLNGRVAICAGQGPGLSNYTLGQTGGTTTTALLGTQLPAHQHTLALTYSTGLGTVGSPENAYLASNGSGQPQYAASGTGLLANGVTGSGAAHNNMQPYQNLLYCICQNGIFPQRA